MQINEKIKAARALKGWTQEQIADAIHEKRTSYSGWEKEIIPSFDIVVKIAKATGMPMAEFIRSVDEDMAKIFSNHDDNSSATLVSEPIVPYGNRHTVCLIELKTASGKTLRVKPEGETEVNLLNAFLEERDRVINTIKEEKQARIDELIKEKDNLNSIIKDYLAAIHTNSKELADDIAALSSENQAAHRAIMDSVDVAAEQPIGTSRAAAGIVEIASEEERVGKGKKAGVSKPS